MTRYSDPADEASFREEEFIQQSLENARRPKGPALAFTGRCHNCGDAVTDPQRFCDEECASEHSYFQERQRANRPTR